MENEINIGIIGFGLMGRVHAQIYETLPGVRVRAIADVRPTRTDHLSHRPTWYQDYVRMVREQPLHAVSICTPENVRIGPVEAACQKGLDIFLEKPVASSVEEATCIEATADKANILVMVGHNLRFMDMYRSARQVLVKRKVGKLKQIVSTRVVSASSAARIKRRCSLPVFLGVHDCDLVRWLAGAEPAYIGAIAEGKRGLAIDYSTALIRFGNGVMAYLNVNWGGSPGKASEYSLELHGTSSTYAVRGSMKKGNGLLPAKLYSSMHAQIEHFVACLRARRVPAIGLADGLAALRMAKTIEDLCARNTGVLYKELPGA